MLSLNEGHRTELSTLRPRRSRLLTFRPLLRQRRPARAIARILEPRARRHAESTRHTERLPHQAPDERRD
jgi:hypothetical protein